MRTLKILFTFVVLALMGACSTLSYEVRVSSMADEASEVCCTYFITPIDESIDESSIAWKRFDRMVGYIVETELGYVRAEDPQTADIGIVAAAGIGAPRTVTRTYPIIGQTGTQVTGTSTTGNATVVGNNVYGSSNTTVHSTPTYGVVGQGVSSNTVYDRWMSIAAYEMVANEDGDFPQIWSTEVRSSGSSGDVNQVAPYMVTAARNHVGKTTSEARQYIIGNAQEAALEIHSVAQGYLDSQGLTELGEKAKAEK